jgi:hypothetical protein
VRVGRNWLHGWLWVGYIGDGDRWGLGLPVLFDCVVVVLGKGVGVVDVYWGVLRFPVA